MADEPLEQDLVDPIVPDTSVQTDPEQTAAAGTVTSEPEGTSDDGAPQKVFTQEELDAIIGKRLARERRAWERELQQQVPKQPSAAESSDLSIDQFETPEEYAHALAQRELETRSAREEAQRILDSHFEREDTARDKYDDYDLVVQNPSLPITQVMANVMYASEIGPDIAYHLGSNPAEAARIAKLSPFLQAKEIGRIESKLLDSPPTRKTSNAPAPITPVRTAGGGKPPVVDTTDPRSCEVMSTADWIKAENERVAKRLEARGYH